MAEEKAGARGRVNLPEPEGPPLTLDELVTPVESRLTWGTTALIYSVSGGGKTTQAQGFRPESTLFIDIESGSDVLPRKWIERSKYVKVDERLSRFGNLVDRLLVEDLPAKGIRTVILDTSSQLEERLAFCLKDVRRPRGFVEIGDYGDAAQRVRDVTQKLTKRLKENGVNLIFFAHDTTNVKGREGEILPAQTSGLATKIIGFFDICGYLAVDPNDGSRVMMWHKDGRVTGPKTRFRCLSPREKVTTATYLRDVFVRCAQEREAKETTEKAEPAATIDGGNQENARAERESEPASAGA